MDKVVTIYDYEGNPTTHIIEDVENLDCVAIVTVSGDETLILRYKDHTVIELDSCHTRMLSCYDGIEFIDVDKLDQLNDPKRKKNT